MLVINSYPKSIAQKRLHMHALIGCTYNSQCVSWIVLVSEVATPLQDQDGDMWQPANWVQLLQPIVSFLSQVVERFGCNTREQLEDMQTSVVSLQQTAQSFKQEEGFPGDRNVINDLSNLAK